MATQQSLTVALLNLITLSGFFGILVAIDHWAISIALASGWFSILHLATSIYQHAERNSKEQTYIELRRKRRRGQ